MFSFLNRYFPKILSDSYSAVDSLDKKVKQSSLEQTPKTPARCQISKTKPFAKLNVRDISPYKRQLRRLKRSGFIRKVKKLKYNRYDSEGDVDDEDTSSTLSPVDSEHTLAPMDDNSVQHDYSLNNPNDSILVNVSDNSSLDWPDFVGNFIPTATSTFIADNKENTTRDVYRQRPQTPKNVLQPKYDTHWDSPMPERVQKVQIDGKSRDFMETWTATLALSRQLNEYLGEMEKFINETNYPSEYGMNHVDKTLNYQMRPNRNKRNTFCITGVEPVFKMDFNSTEMF